MRAVEERQMRIISGIAYHFDAVRLELFLTQFYDKEFLCLLIVECEKRSKLDFGKCSRKKKVFFVKTHLFS